MPYNAGRANVGCGWVRALGRPPTGGYHEASFPAVI